MWTIYARNWRTLRPENRDTDMRPRAKNLGAPSCPQHSRFARPPAVGVRFALTHGSGLLGSLRTVLDFVLGVVMRAVAPRVDMPSVW